MSEPCEMIQDRFGLYEHMAAEELESVLRDDLEAGNDSQLDSETLLYVMQLYARKQKKPPKTAQEAYAEFCRDYLPDVHTLSEEGQFCCYRKKIRKWRLATSGAAILALLLGLGLCGGALVPRMGRPTCHQTRDFLTVRGAQSQQVITDLEEIARRCSPQWLPDGYEPVDAHRDGEYCSTVYCRGEPEREDTITVIFQTVGAGQRIQFQKDAASAGMMLHNGVRVYRYTNGQWNCALGCFDGILFQLTAKLSDEEMLRILTSMEIGTHSA